MTAATRIMAFTGTRADFGLLRPVLMRIREERTLTLQLVAGGSHFDAEYGSTSTEILNAGFEIDWRVDAELTTGSAAGIARVTAATIMSVAEAIESLAPDVAIVLGDRYEALGFATACLLGGVPLAHIHGGETTEGAIDDAIRHAITQMATLHFVAGTPFADRLVAMGTPAERVAVVGAPGLDTVASVIEGIDDPRAVLESIVGPLSTNGPLFLVAFHPETRSQADPSAVMRNIIETLLSYPDSTLVISAPNADLGRNGIAAVIEQAQRDCPEQIRVVRSFGHENFIAALRTVDVIVGNSSSGIIEAPFIGTPTVDIGDRQRGRPAGESVIHADIGHEAIAKAVSDALNRGRRAPANETIYGDGRAGRRIVRHLLEYCGT